MELSNEVEKHRKNSLKNKEVYPKYSKNPWHRIQDESHSVIDNTRNEETEDEYMGYPMKGDPKKFYRPNLWFLDIFANFKFGFWKFFYGIFSKAKGQQLRDKAMSHLSQTQVLFKKRFDTFEEDICIEHLLGYIYKLQASVAALMEKNPKAQNFAKLTYFSNQIVYKSRETEK